MCILSACKNAYVVYMHIIETCSAKTNSSQADEVQASYVGGKGFFFFFFFSINFNRKSAALWQARNIYVL